MQTRSIFIFFAATLLYSCSASRRAAQTASKAGNEIKVTLDLVNIQNDKVAVSVVPPAITTATINYHFAKIIPGTYAIEDYGRYIEDLKATSKSGSALNVVQKDVNTWEISNADQLASVTYLVNDTYDNEGADVFKEGSTTIFSPAGTNILAGKNFMLNMCGFAGYFEGWEQTPYNIAISHPANLRGVSSLDDLNASDTADLFHTSRYAEMVDCPIMYAAPDISQFKIGTMDVILTVYSPANKNITAGKLSPGLEQMMRAQKNFLGDINHTRKYAVITYLSTMAPDDAKGFGALEHNFSTTSVFRSSMNSSELTHVISHEFFHTLTPLNIHSKEIQYFDFRDPKMSEHLWMYEGLTEYFANLFQVNQGLIKDPKFLALMQKKIENSRKLYNDSLSFTIMSKNVLDEKMKAQYPNVYEKGALMAMCLDIIMREKSGGKKGIKDVMGELSKMYGPDKPFDDAELIPRFTKITYPEVGEFIDNYIVKGGPINYDEYLARVGVTPAKVPVPEDIVFLAYGKPYLRVDTVQKKVYAVVKDTANHFMNTLGLQDGDILLEMNDVPFDAGNIMNVLIMGFGLEEGDPVTMKIERNGNPMQLKGNIALNYVEGDGHVFTDQSKKALYEAWLKGK